MIFGIFGTVFSVFSVFFASYHFVSHPKNSVSLQSETSETNLFFAISLRSFSLSFRFVSLPSEMRGHQHSPVPTQHSSVPTQHSSGTDLSLAPYQQPATIHPPPPFSPFAWRVTWRGGATPQPGQMTISVSSSRQVASSQPPHPFQQGETVNLAAPPLLLPPTPHKRGGTGVV